MRHASRFLLVGTMNPEEGELRPQLLDRFGLTVEAVAPPRPGARAPRWCAAGSRSTPTRSAFADRWRDAEDATGRAHRGRPAPAAVGRRCRTRPCARWPRSARGSRSTGCGPTSSSPGPRSRMPPGRAGARSASTTCARGPGSHCRTDGAATRSTPPVWTRTSSTRRSRMPPSSPSRSPTRRPEPQPDQDPDRPDHDPPGGGESATEQPSGVTASRRSRGAAEQPAGGPDRAVPAEADRDPGARRGRGRPPVAGRNGLRAGHPGPRATPRPAGSTCRPRSPAAAPHQRARGRAPGGGLVLRRDDLRKARHEGREGNLVLFVVDASGSMAARARMGAVKGAVLSLLLDAYQRRDKVGLITFRGAGAELLLPPTSSVEAAAARLTALPTGGRTPLAAGLLQARHTLRVERLRDPRRRPLLVVVTDGRATGLPGTDPRGRRSARGRAARRGRDRHRRRRLRIRPDSARARGPAGHDTGRGRVAAGGTVGGRVGVHGAGGAALGEGGGLMPQGKPATVPDDGLTTRQRRTRPLVIVHTGRDEGEVDGRLRARPAGLDPGLADRGVPVRQERQVEGRRGKRAARARAGARADRRGRAGRLAQDGRGLVMDPARPAPNPTTPPTPARAGRRSSATWPPRRTASTCSTSSPTR